MTQDPVFDRAWTHIKAERDGHVATISLHRPEAKNALKSNTEYLDEIAQATKATAKELTGK